MCPKHLLVQALFSRTPLPDRFAPEKPEIHEKWSFSVKFRCGMAQTKSLGHPRGRILGGVTPPESANALGRYFARGVHFPKKVDFWKFPRYSANIAKISCNFNCGNISQEQADFLRSAAPALLVPALFYGSTQGINGTLVSIRAGAYIG